MQPITIPSADLRYISSSDPYCLQYFLHIKQICIILVPYDTVHMVANLFPVWHSGKLNFKLFHNPLHTTLCYIFSSLISTTGYPRTGKCWGRQPLHPSDVSNQTSRIEQAPYIFAYKGYLHNAIELSHTGHRSYVGRYRT